MIRERAPWHFDLASASRLLTDQLGTLDLRGFGADVLPLAIGAAGALLQYVRDTQRTALPHIRALQVEESGDALAIDAATRRNLELDSSLTGNDAATLLAVLDTTVTGHGRARAAPLARPADQQSPGAAPALPGRRRAGGGARLRAAPGAAARGGRSRAHTGAHRAAQRPAARPGAAAQCARPNCRRSVRRSRRSTHRSCAPCTRTPPITAPKRALLHAAIAAEPSAFLRDGDVIAPGYDAELDELRRIATHTDEFLLDLEQRERERTGLSGLKLGYNRVQGFYIEIPRAQAEQVPAEYLRRQTVKSAERFITPELKSFEDRVLGARERALAREKQLYEELLTRLIEIARPAAVDRHGARGNRRAGVPVGTRREPQLERARTGRRAAASRSRARATRSSSATARRRSCPTIWTCTPSGACW